MLIFDRERLRRSWLDPFMKFMTYAGGTIGVSALMIALVFYLVDIGRVSDAKFAAILIIGGTIIANGIKPFFKTERPASSDALIKTPRSTSFPSGHSMASLCLALAAIYAVVTAPSLAFPTQVFAVAGCLLYAFTVGVSRVYLGVHWPSDVIGSWLLGTAWVAAVILLARVGFLPI